MQAYKWTIKSPDVIHNLADILPILLQNRGIDNPEAFLESTPPIDFAEQDAEFAKLIGQHVIPAAERISAAIKDNRPIIIHGDYDVDGQTATAILWQAIYNDLGYSHVYPYIPNRLDEGYGLSAESIKGMQQMLRDANEDLTHPLLITVDCGIVSHQEVLDAKDIGFEVIITDHHTSHGGYPEADEIIHTTGATGAGISYLLSHYLGAAPDTALAALGTICDLQPLTGYNRTIAKIGLGRLQPPRVTAIGLKALYDVSKISDSVGTYEVGWQIGPRLNATGRLEDARESLRLLCTNSPKQARELAEKLNSLNRDRQDKTQAGLQVAIKQFSSRENLPDILVTANGNYHEGIIGLIAGKLTQQYYRPAIAIAVDSANNVAKGSARSIRGISIIDELRKFNELFINVGGHEMAAGFSILPENIAKLETKLTELEWDESIFQRKLDIDAEIGAKFISHELLHEIDKLKPFGIGNPEPTFLTRGFTVYNLSWFGKENQHLKLFLRTPAGENVMGMQFSRGGPEKSALSSGSQVDIAYNLALDTWNGKNELQLKIRDISTT